MTARIREEELREVPVWKVNRGAAPGVRLIGMDEADCLGVDRRGNLYWDGKPVEVRNFALTFGQKVWAGIVRVSAVVGAVGAATQGCGSTTSGRAASDGGWCPHAHPSTAGFALIYKRRPTRCGRPSG